MLEMCVWRGRECPDYNEYAGCGDRRETSDDMSSVTRERREGENERKRREGDRNARDRSARDRGAEPERQKNQ